MNLKQQQTSTALLEFKDRVVYVRLLEDADIDIDSLREQQKAQEDLTSKCGQYAVLVDGTKSVRVSGEARKAMAEYVPENRRATAIVTNRNLVTRLLANFYMRMNNPKVPTRLFEREEDAIPWLNKFLKN